MDPALNLAPLPGHGIIIFPHLSRCDLFEADGDLNERFSALSLMISRIFSETLSFCPIFGDYGLHD